MHQSVFDATVDELISHGWGSHPRALIPADWMTRRGPDAIWGAKMQRAGRTPKRQTFRERRAIFDSAQKYVTD